MFRAAIGDRLAAARDGNISPALPRRGGDMGCGQRGDVCTHAMRHVGGARRLLRRPLPQHMGRGGPAGRPCREMTRSRGIQCPERAAAKARSPGNSAQYNGPPASVGEALSRRYRTRAAGPHCAFARCRAPPWVSPTVSSGAGRAARRPAMPVIGVISAGSRHKYVKFPARVAATAHSRLWPKCEVPAECENVCCSG